MLTGVTVTEEFDWMDGFLATGRAFFGEGSGLGGLTEFCEVCEVCEVCEGV